MLKTSLLRAGGASRGRGGSPGTTPSSAAASFHISGILSTRPWQLDAADALADVDRVVEVDEVGQVVDPVPARSARSSRRLSRTGSSIGLSVQICEWQVMHVSVGGMPANGRVSTDVWQ